MLIVGTIIGAGFASGREIVSFFGAGYISPLIAPVCGLLIAAGSFLFLYIGHKTKAKNVTDINRRIFGKLHLPADIFLLFNSLIVLAAMLAGMDSLGDMFFHASPAYSIVAGLLCAVISYKGLRGLVRCNAVLIPLVVAVLITVCALHAGAPLSTPDFGFGLPSCVIYVAMNMILASTVLGTTDISVKCAAGASLAAGGIMSVLMYLIITALNAHGAEGAMPILFMAKNMPVLFYIMAAVVGAAIFTTMLTSASGLTDWLCAQCGDRRFSSAAVLLAGLILSNLGFETVVSFLYPLIGALGGVYMFAALLYVTLDTRFIRAIRRPFQRRRFKKKNLPAP